MTNLPPISKIFANSALDIDCDQTQSQKQRIENRSRELGVPVKVENIYHGPRLTRFSLKAAAGDPASKIIKFEKDLAVALSGAAVELEAPSQNNPVVSLLIERNNASNLSLRPILESNAFRKHSGALKVGLGTDTFGKAVVVDLASLPHLLIGGTTGTGKSVCLNTIIAGLLCSYSPTYLSFIMIDPNQVELKQYTGLPHLAMPVITQSAYTLKVLNGVSREINRRYQLMAQLGARNIIGFNQKAPQAGQRKLPYLIIVIDNLLDLMMDAPKALERVMAGLAQKARGAGVHLIMVTLRSNVDSVAGSIKANFPGRIALKTANKTDSQLIIDAAGAERLLNHGDMLFKSAENPLRRLQGAIVSEQELVKIIQFWKEL